MIWLHNGIAHALLGQDQLAAAKQESDAALALATAKLGAENQIMISIETCQGRIARLQGDHGRADVAFEAALAIAQKLYHPQWRGVELHYGLSQLDQQHYAKAEALFASSLAHARALAGDRPDSSVLLAEIGRGVALAGLGQQAEGEALAKPALERLHQQFPLEHRHYAEAEELYRRLGRH
jgi:hypothetical protein